MLILKNSRISLELIQEKHAESLFHLIGFNIEILQKWFPWAYMVPRIEEWKHLILQYQKRFVSNSAPTFCIYDKTIPVGVININQINWNEKNCTIGYWVTQSHWGKGIATESCSLLLKYIFDSLKLEEVQIKCGSANQASIRVAQKLGFHYETLIPKGEKLPYGYIDLVVFSRYLLNKKQK